MDKLYPTHVAIIMDGNRRWAAAHGLPAQKGHEAGVEALEQVVKAAVKFNIKYLTVFALSTENLKKRSSLEVTFLFSLVEKGLKERLSSLNENGVRIKIIGRLDLLPLKVRQLLEKAEGELAKNKRLFLNIALNYGSREEIVQAFEKLVRAGKKTLTEEDFGDSLYTAGIPDPDLIIRTGGQKRLSNFLLWQASYSELYFTDTLWPDFGEGEFKKALEDYRKRKRNFGR